MKKRVKLTILSKIIITIILVATGLLIYKGITDLGKNLNTLSTILTSLGWIWLIFGQVVFLMSIWED